MVHANAEVGTRPAVQEDHQHLPPQEIVSHNVSGWQVRVEQGQLVDFAVGVVVNYVDVPDIASQLASWTLPFPPWMRWMARLPTVRLVEIAEPLGVIKQRAHQIRQRAWLPLPRRRGWPRSTVEPVRGAGVGEARAPRETLALVVDQRSRFGRR